MTDQERNVLVIGTKGLFNILGGHFQGFKRLDEDIIRVLEGSSFWLNKEQAKEDPNYKQLIGYCVVRNPDGELFLYQRATQNKAHQEKRLQGKWSLGIGGHIEPVDKGSIAASKIMNSSIREIGEELSFRGGITSLKLIGGINDDSNPVGQVQFGLLLLADIYALHAEPKDPEIAHGCFRCIDYISDLFNDPGYNIETWSQICLAHIPQ